ncbi:MAG: Thiosulfate sulfurtransferase, rhodanese, partial [uncultured Thermomicrobiales bacterium]
APRLADPAPLPTGLPGRARGRHGRARRRRRPAHAVGLAGGQLSGRAPRPRRRLSRQPRRERRRGGRGPGHPPAGRRGLAPCPTGGSADRVSPAGEYGTAGARPLAAAGVPGRPRRGRRPRLVAGHDRPPLPGLRGRAQGPLRPRPRPPVAPGGRTGDHGGGLRPAGEPLCGPPRLAAALGRSPAGGRARRRVGGLAGRRWRRRARLGRGVTATRRPTGASAPPARLHRRHPGIAGPPRRPDAGGPRRPHGGRDGRRPRGADAAGPDPGLGRPPLARDAARRGRAAAGARGSRDPAVGPRAVARAGGGRGGPAGRRDGPALARAQAARLRPRQGLRPGLGGVGRGRGTPDRAGV